MSTAVTSIDRLAIGDAVRSLALSYARKTGAAIDAVVVKTANAKEEFSMGPVRLMLAMKATLSAEEIDALPLPGLRWKDDKGNVTNNPDIAEWRDPSKPDAKAKEISFYVVWSDGTPEGSNVVREIEWCSRVAQENMRLDDIPADWLKKYQHDTIALKKRKRYLEGRRGTVRKNYKDATRLLWQLDMVNELAGCGAEIDDTGEDSSVTVFHKSKRSMFKVMSVGAFMKLNVAKANEQGGTYEALVATAERGTKTPATTPGLAVNAIATPETLDKAMLMVHSYLDKCMHAKQGGDYAALLRHLNSDAGKQAILTLGGVKRSLDELFRMDTIRNTFDVEAAKLRPAA